MRAVCFVGFVFFPPFLSLCQANSIDLGGGWQAARQICFGNGGLGACAGMTELLHSSSYCKEGEVDSFPMLHTACATLCFSGLSALF